jgi:ATP-dependent Zn protease
VINYDDFTMARDTHEYGIRQPVKAMSPVDKRRIAYHEAGHTVAQLEYAPITRERFAKVTLMRYGNLGPGVGGFSQTKPTEESVGAAQSREEILADIRISLGSRAAEEIFLGTRLNGVGGDFGSATRMAAAYLYQWGMEGTIINPFALVTPQAVQISLDGPMQIKIEGVLQEQYAEVKALIERRRDEVVAIAEALIERDELNSQDVDDILRKLEQDKAAAVGGGSMAASMADTTPLPAINEGIDSANVRERPLGGTSAAFQPASEPAKPDEQKAEETPRETRGAADD